MAITKYASFEVSKVLEVKGSPDRKVTASLDKLSDFHDYRTSDGYLYARIRAISSRTNKNHDGWPSVELAGSPEIMERHAKESSTGFTVEAADGSKEYGFATFVGKPVFVDHNNSNPKRARGVIVDSKLNVLASKESSLDPYYASGSADPEHMPPTEVELLLEVDAKRFPKLAKAIEKGEIDGFSMGCDVDRSKCSHCGNVATSPEEYCFHIKAKGAEHDFKTADGKRESKKSYENCYGIKFFEISAVFDPADETALAKEIRSSVQHEGVLVGEEGTLPDPLRPNDQDVAQTVQQLIDTGIPPEAARQMATRHMQPHLDVPGEGSPIAELHPSQYDDVGTVNGLPIGTPPVKREDVPPGMDPNQWYRDEEMLDKRHPNRPVMNEPTMSSTHVAENPLPQSFETKAPDAVDTLRQEKVCPVCGEDMEGDTCDVCGYEAPPKGFDNPDLTKAKGIEEELKANDNVTVPNEEGGQPPEDPSQGPPTDGPTSKQPGSFLQQKTRNPAPTASVIGDMRWQPKIDSRLGARINKDERPIKVDKTPATNEPTNQQVTSDQAKPVTSAMLTARQLIEAAQRNHTGETMSTRTADGPTGPDAAADKRVDVEGIGGVIEPSNEQASKADAQVAVDGIGGTGVEGVEADSSVDLPAAGDNDAGFNKDKTTEDSGPTKTWGDSDGTEKAYTDPVTPRAFPEASVKTAGDSEPFVNDDINKGGSANKGVEPVDPVGKADERVDVRQTLTSPENNSGPTKTWSGTDGNGVLKQQDPVTPESIAVDNAWNSHTIAALKVVDTEIALRVTAPEDKYNRLAQLMSESDEVLTNTEVTLARVKTAGEKLAQARVAGTQKLPSFKRVATGTQETKPEVQDETILDSGLFLR